MLTAFLITGILGFAYGFAVRTASDGLDAPRVTSIPGGVATAMLAAWFVFIRFLFFTDGFRDGYSRLMRAAMDWCVAEFGIIGLFLAMAVGIAFICGFLILAVGVIVGFFYIPFQFLRTIPAFLRGTFIITHYMLVPYPMQITVDPEPGHNAAIHASVLKQVLDLNGILLRLRTSRLRRQAVRDAALAEQFKTERVRGQQQLAEALAGLSRSPGR